MQFKLDNTGDLAIEDDSLVMIEGLEEIRQLLMSRLNTFYSEYFLNRSIGIPYFEVVFEKRIKPSIIYSLFVDVIINTDGVLELSNLEIDVDYEKRQGTVEVECRVDTGFINFTLPLGVN